ncbi:hypothetical protein [Rugosimonospora africana]|uniref:hypothetical protein n=1 Tax=Rugosimonospora africana TaxID=556532 RepID=UPI0019429C10|nr:hypothetical protein [Rugosimonospora africana]
MACDPNALISALTVANAGTGGTLSLASKCTYTLTAVSAPPSSSLGDGLPVIIQPITIIGNDATIVRGANAGAFRIFDVANGGSLTAQNLTVAGGQDSATSPNGAGIRIQTGGNAFLTHVTVRGNQAVAGNGGGIDNAGVAIVNDSAFTANSASADGGGVRNTGFLGVTNSTFTGNSAVRGGGVFNGGGLELTDSTLSHNQASGQGGGLFVDAPAITATVSHSDISGNNANNGGGIFSQGVLLLNNNTTVTGNFASGSGAGIFNTGPLTVNDSKITGNTSRGSGGGLTNVGGNVVLRRTEISGNTTTLAGSQGAGITTNPGTLALFASQVSNNTSPAAPGGINSALTALTIDNLSAVAGNRPANCQGNTPIANCFG